MKIVIKNIALIIFIFSLLTYSPDVEAYGGGGGFTPSFPTPPRFEIVCAYKTVTIKLLYNRTHTFRYPLCRTKIVRAENNDFDNRWNDFMNRAKNGGA